MGLPAENFRILENKLVFSGAVVELPGWLLYKISKKHYEKHFAWMFPAQGIYCRVRILKNKGP
jgi:hypothetical protein